MRLSSAILILLLAGLVISAVVCVVKRNLIKTAIAIAAVSAILSTIMFLHGAPLAAVFELSVCAGLITVIFISAISMTRIQSKEEHVEMERARRKRFKLLPAILLLLLFAMLFFLWPYINSFVVPKAAIASDASVQDVLWNKMQADLLGQIVIILAGVFGVLLFFKESDTK